MEHVHKLGTENGVGCSEATAREDTQLQELSDGAVLGHLWMDKEKELLVSHVTIM